MSNYDDELVYSFLVTSDSFEEAFPVTSEFFEGAIEHIEVHGWTQGREVDHLGHVCAVGALRRTTLRSLSLSFAVDQPKVHAYVLQIHNSKIMELMGIGDYSSIPSWNDGPRRTREEVIDAFTRAAKTLRDQGR